MALTLRTLVTVMEETDDHNKKVVKDLEDKIKKLTRTTKLQKTWQHKTTNQVRRQKTTIRNMTNTIDAMETEYMELKTETDELKTMNDTLETEIATLDLDNERNTEDFKTLTKRLADNSCAYCGTPTPAPAPAPAPATSSSDAQAKWFTPW